MRPRRRWRHDLVEVEVLGVDELGVRADVDEEALVEVGARDRAPRRPRTSSVAARSVSRSAAPGPAPTKWTVIGLRASAHCVTARAGVQPVKRPDRRGPLDGVPGELAAVLGVQPPPAASRSPASRRGRRAVLRAAAASRQASSSPARSRRRRRRSRPGRAGRPARRVRGRARPRGAGRRGGARCGRSASARSRRPRSRSPGTAGARASTRCRPTRRPRRRPRAADRAAGASRARAAGAQVALGQLAVVLEGVVGQSGGPRPDDGSVELERDHVQPRRRRPTRSRRSPRCATPRPTPRSPSTTTREAP